MDSDTDTEIQIYSQEELLEEFHIEEDG